MHERITQLTIDLEQALISEKEAIAEKMEHELRANQLQKMVDRLTALNEQLERKLDMAYDELKKTKQNEMVARMKQVLAEQYANAMRFAIQDVLEKTPKISKEDRQIILEEIERMTNMVFDRISNTMALAKTLKEGEIKHAE